MADIELIIKVPENNYNQIKSTNDFYLTAEERLIKYGTPIPDNATNGEIADMMFPDVNIGHRYWFPDSTIRFMDTDWWNAPYQKGGKE